MKKPTCLKNSLKDFKKIFEEVVTVKVITEENLYIPQSEEPAIKVKEEMREKGFDNAPIVEKDGSIIRYVKRENIDEQGLCGDYAKGITINEIITADTPLLKVFGVLQNRYFCFVICDNKISGIVTKADLQKLPVRIYLFGIISLLEMHMTEIIKRDFKDESWKQHLSSERIKEAEKRRNDCKKNNVELSSVDYLQLCDKRDILTKSEKISSLDISKNKFEDDLKKIGELRDNLAHSQPKVENCLSWLEITEIVKIIENYIEKFESIYS